MSRFKPLNISMWVWVALGLVWSLYEHARGQKRSLKNKRAPKRRIRLEALGVRLKLILHTPLATTQRNHHQNGAGKRKDPWLRIHGEPTSQEHDDFPCATCNRWSTDCCGPWETPQEHDE